MQQQFAQISDLHLSSLEDIDWRDFLNKRALGYLSWKRKRQFEHQMPVLDALRDDLRQYQLDQILVSGDLTHVGLPHEFKEARQWLEQLDDADNIALVPGNHDAYVRSDWLKTFALWQAYMTSDSETPGAADFTNFPTLRVRGGIAFIGLSTACPKPPLMASGTVGQSQLAKLPGLLARAGRDGLFRVVYLHHSPVVGEEKWRKRLTDAAAVTAIVARHGAELILHGHGHRAHQSELVTDQGARPVIAVPSASAMGLGHGDVAAYNCYRVEPRETEWLLEIETRHFEKKSETFVTSQPQTLTIERWTN
ncbi:MAG: metallophosphoesterase [Halioglobus sp.]